MTVLRATAARARVVWRLALWTSAGFAAGMLLAVVAPLAVGYRPLTVLSGSMEPALATGDVTVVKRIEPAEARVGNIVTYRDPQGKLVTHRVRRVRSAGQKVRFVTKGDANNMSERWSMAADGELSRTVYRVPMAGYALSIAQSRLGRLLMVALPLLLLAGIELVRIWRPHEELGVRRETAIRAQSLRH